MPAAQTSEIMRFLRGALRAPQAGEVTDGQLLGRFVERHRVAGLGHTRRNRATENDNAIGGAAGGIPWRKSLLQREDQRIAERR